LSNDWDYFFGLGACQIHRMITATMMRKLRIEVVAVPPGIFACTSGEVIAPDAISNAIETIQ
jgi:hypothetical protein